MSRPGELTGALQARQYQQADVLAGKNGSVQWDRHGARSGVFALTSSVVIFSMLKIGRAKRGWYGRKDLSDVPGPRLDIPFRDVSRLTLAIDPNRPRVQRLNIFRGGGELVQDRLAGDNV
jgi:hypothetical protein